jgi:hypothetical protein
MGVGASATVACIFIIGTGRGPTSPVSVVSAQAMPVTLKSEALAIASAFALATAVALAIASLLGGPSFKPNSIPSQLLAPPSSKRR